MIHLKRGSVNFVHLSLKERQKDFGTPSEYVIEFRNMQDTEVITLTADAVSENSRTTLIQIDASEVTFNAANYEYLAFGVIDGENVLFERGTAHVEGNQYQDSPTLAAQIDVNYEAPN